MVWSDVLQAVFVLPFTAGNSRNVRNRTVHLDGTTSIVVIRILFLSLIFLLVKTTTEQEGTLIEFTGIQIILSIVVLLGLLSCMTAVIVIKVKGFNSIMVRRQKVTTSRLQMIVMWIFGILSVMFCFLKSGHIIECIYTVKHNFIGDIPIMECVYYVIIFVFLPVQMLSVTYFTPYRFKSFLRIQYMVLLVVASNMTMWVYGLVEHNQYFSKVTHGNDTWHNNCTNLTITRMLYVTDKILLPIFLEYSLLAITLTQNLSVEWETNNSSDENQLLEIQSSTETTARTFDENEVESSFNTAVGPNAETPLLSPELTTGSSQRKRKQSFLFYIILLLACLLAISIFIGYIVRITGHIQTSQDWLIGLELVLAVIMSLCTFVAYYLATRDTDPPFKSAPISTGEYVFIISSVGSLMGSVLRIIPALKINHNNYMYLIIPSRVIFCATSYLQTVLILHVSRCRPKRHGYTASLRGVLLLLSLYNCGCWVVESFIIGSFPELDHEEKQLLGSSLLELSTQVCHPLNVFFRFASALELYELFKKFGK
ncbi:uncharacterized protein LOC132555680 [Ylistrum balloti]|uniref:uncharacterized protein LOC132555680 n=1 Tax=Ylistrum balloti TaxID=509963 RepID=UPI002905B273|nr:uncharacterized protein LOC132555680 [Ylistrum balloti]